MRWLFGSKKGSITAIVDVHSSAVSVGYFYTANNQPPYAVETIEFPVEPNATEPEPEAVLRVLSLALKALVRRGAPKLMKKAGRSRTDRVVLSISPPWLTQTTSFVGKKSDVPFQITETLVESLLSEKQIKRTGWEMVSQTVVAMYLNGYEVDEPYGRKASELEAIALTSATDTKFSELVKTRITAALHTKHIETTSFTSEFYFRYGFLFPHQHDYLFLDIGTTLSTAMMVKHGLLVASGEYSFGSRDITSALHATVISSSAPQTDVVSVDSGKITDTFVEKIKSSLSTLGQEEPLPQLVLYTCPDSIAPFVEHIFNDKRLCELWISHDHISAHRVTGREFASGISAAEKSVPSLPLLVLAGAL